MLVEGNEFSVMVIPKPNRLPGLVTLEVLGPCPNTGWNVEVECPAELPAFLGQDLGAAGTSCRSATQTYYFARFREITIHDYIEQPCSLQILMDKTER